MLRIHRAERADRLVAGLASVVARPLEDALRPEIVAVPTRGVERWLTQRLSASLGASPDRADGVCANIDFPFPGRLVSGAVAAASGVDPQTDSWLPERAVWPLLEVVQASLGQDWLAALATHLGASGPDADEHRRARRYGAVRHLADLFDRYAVHRPAMLRSWAEGRDTDGAGAALPADLRWQAQLWRALRERLGSPSPAERLDHACARLRAEPAVVDLPPRLSLFGLTRLPASYLDVLLALGAARDVHLLLLHPSPALWRRVADTPRAPGTPRRRQDPTADLPRNPLLATWGRDAREMQLVVTAGDGIVDQHHPLTEEPATLLGRLQADVRADRRPPGAPLPREQDRRALLEPADNSLQVHACHGRARQVEVVRDAILHLLADDPTLEPRDIIVMCPDIDAFAPLIQATFGVGALADDDGEHVAAANAQHPVDLGVRLADRSLRQVNPVLGVVSELLALATARLTASQVIDFASRDPVRRRFRLDDDDLARIEEWVGATGIRWGLDAGHRTPYKLDSLDANTWRAGLDRLLVGVTMSEDDQRLVGGALPLDDVDSGDIDLAGRVAELIDRLRAAIRDLSHAQPLAAWARALAAAAESLTATSERDTWQHAQLRRLLGDVVDEGTASSLPLVLAEVADLLADRLRGRPTRANFRTGHLTMCTLVPMRSVPHRVVCLLGLDDGLFPRQTAADGDDLVERDQHVGDRDPRSEDRQLLLDALLAATDHLVITYSGRDERTNAKRPKAVPVGELLDVVDATARPAGGDRPAREHVVVHHPLQPFDARNFTRGTLVRDRTWSFDAIALGGARAASRPRMPEPAFLAAPLPAGTTDLIELDQLVRFLQHPVRAFLRQRLGIVVLQGEEEAADALPVELSKLDEWHVGQRLLEARLAGNEAATCLAAEIARGSLPPGALGGPIIERIATTAEGIVEAATGLVVEPAEPGSVEVDVTLGGRCSLIGTVPGVVGDLLRPVTYSTVGARHRLTAWVQLLAITAAHPERPFEAATVGRGTQGRIRGARIPALAAAASARREAALDQLGVLVDLYLRGLREPLPLYCKTSAAWAGARVRGTNPEPAALKEWTTTWEWNREDAELEHQLVLGGVTGFHELLRAPPRDDEGWAHDEPTRFGCYARRAWDGLLAREQVAQR